MTSHQTIDWQPIQGVSLEFILIWFGPLAMAVLVGFQVRTVAGLQRAGIILSVLWLLFSAPAFFFLWMGYTFESSASLPPFIQCALWFAGGEVVIWIPLALKISALAQRAKDRR